MTLGFGPPCSEPCRGTRTPDAIARLASDRDFDLIAWSPASDPGMQAHLRRWLAAEAPELVARLLVIGEDGWMERLWDRLATAAPSS